MLINRKYKHEVGIDVQGLIQRSLGSTLILKIKRKEKLVNLTGSKNFRFQLNLSGTFPVSEKTTQTDTVQYRYSNKGASSFTIQPMFGIERIKFYGKFNFYSGVDFGPYYSYSDNGYLAYKYTYLNNTTYGYNNYIAFPIETQSKKYGVSVAPFIGIKYRISSHFSASLESGFYLSYFITKEKNYNIPFFYNPNNSTTLISEKTSHGFDFSMKYLRFLTINYHL